MSQLLIPGRRRIPGPALPIEYLSGGRKRCNGGAFGSSTEIDAFWVGVPVMFVDPLTSVQPGVNGPPDWKRVIPEICQPSVMYPAGRHPIPRPGLGSRY